METRRSTGGRLSPSKGIEKGTKAIKPTRVSSRQWVQAKSKPMLVIPQPVLLSHECLDETVRLAQVESNAYIALGIKEEPIDIEYEHDGRSWEEASYKDQNHVGEETVLPDPTMSDQYEIEGKRTTRSSKRRRLLGLEDPSNLSSLHEDDANNNSKTVKKTSPRARKGRFSNSTSDFNPIVLSVVSMSEGHFPLDTEPCHLPVEHADKGVVGAFPDNNNLPEKGFQSTADEGISSIPAKKQSPGNVGDNKRQLTEAVPRSARTTKLNSLKVKHGTIVGKPKAKKVVPESDPSTADDDELENRDEEEDEDEDVVGDQHSFSSTPSSEESEDEDSTPKLWIPTEDERKTIACSVCKKKFSRISILTAHKKKHFDFKVYNCTHCNKTFSSESSYKHHIAYSGLAPYKCDQCHKSYYTKQKADAHRAQCKGKNTEKKYNCEECGRSYVMLCSLRTHIRERHSDFKPVKNLCCEICGKRFRHKKYLELHMYSHSSEKNFECTICHRKYKSTDILRHHIRMVHKNLPRVICEVCNKEVSRVSLKAHLNRHKEKKEEEEESARHLLSLTLAADNNAPFCQICNKYFENDKLLEMHACEGVDGSYACPHCSGSVFATASDLVQHTCDGLDNSKSRNSAKIYKCVFCCREYNCHTPWLYHVRHHTNDKPYPCTECDKSFRLRQGLKVHMRNHTGEKPFRCDHPGCSAAFKQKPFLLDHMNTHTGNKPYQCVKCFARFSVRSALSTHKRIHRREMKRQAEAAL